MFAKSYINNILLPRAEINPDPPQVSVVFNGTDEYVDVINEDMRKFFNNEELNGLNFMNLDPTNSEKWWLSIWYKFTGDNTSGDDKVLLHNGLAGNDAFKIYAADGENDLKVFIGDGDGDGNTEVTISNGAVANEWNNITLQSYKFTSGIRKLICCLNGAFVASQHVTLSDIYTNDNSEDHFTIGCYRATFASGTPANFFKGEIGQVTCLGGLAFFNYAGLYGQGMGFDMTNWNLLPPENIIMDMQMGDLTISQYIDGGDNDDGGNDGDDNLILFDSKDIRRSARTDRAAGKGLTGAMAAGDWTFTNGWAAVSGGDLDGTLLRLRGSETNPGLATFDEFTPVVGRLYKVELAYKVSSAAGDGNDTITFAGTTLYTGTNVTAVIYDSVWVKASSTNKLIVTAFSDSDSSTTMLLIDMKIYEYDRYGIMVNMTQASNFAQPQGPAGGHITP